MNFFADRVSLNHEIDRNPRLEDAGRIKVEASILMSEEPMRDCRTVLAFSLPAKDIHDSYSRYRWVQLNCLEDDVRLNPFQVDYAKECLTTLAIDVLYPSSVNYSPDWALLIYITFKFTPTDPTMYMRVPLIDESTIHIRSRPASKSAVESLSRKVYKKTTMSISDKCTICFDEFTMGERVVTTLPCGHEFDDSCILEWFATNHVCPLCRFELPCEI